MSVRLMSTVWEMDLPAGEKIVLLALADQANDEGRQCWPSVETIMRKSGQGERTVRRALASLEDQGHLTRHHRVNDSTQYHLHPCQNGTPAKSAVLPNTPVRGAKLAPKPPRTTIPQKATPSSGKRATSKPVGTTVPSDFIPEVKPDSITGKVMAAWPPGQLDEQVEHFIDRHTTQGTLSLDWQASWRTWVKNWKTFNGNRTQRRVDGKPDLRGSRPDPSLDLLQAARRAEAEQRDSARDWSDHRGGWTALPAF